MTERVLSEVVELDLDRCANVYGVSPCAVGRVESGTAQAGASTTLTLRAGASAVDDAYNGMTARLTSGAGSVQERKILDYVGATKVATMEKAWSTNALTKSSAVDHANWTKQNGITITANYGLAPDGTQKAERVQTDGVSLARYFQQVNGFAGLTVCFSLKMKSNTGANQTITFFLRETGFGTTYATGSVTVTPEWGLFSVSAAIPGGSAGVYALVYDAAGTNVWDIQVCDHQWNQGSAPLDFIETDAAAITLPGATSVYDVIDRANACYNTFRTCQDKPNYVKGTQTLRFTGVGQPINKASPARPYISRLTTAPTEIDPEQATGRRASSSVGMVDESDADVETDPYVRDRVSPAGGTFWTRFFARNQNYAGRAARVKRGFVDHGTFGAYDTERFVIEGAKGPDARGEVSFSLKDPIKLLDRAKAPTPTSGRLAVILTTNDLQITLESGQGTQYDATGYVRVGDEVIRYTGNAADVLSWPNGTYRGQFGTEAVEGAVGDGVQQCLVYLDTAFSAVVEDLHNRGGIVDADLDLAGLASEELIWLGNDFRVASVCITDPEDITTLLQELLQPAGMTTWWSPTEQKVKFKVVAPASPAVIVTTVLDDTEQLMDGSVANERLEDLRVTLASVDFGLRTAIANADEALSYKQSEVHIDVDAEGPNEYNERRVISMRSRFYGADNITAMRTFVQRYVARHRDAPERIEFVADPKDQALVEGDIVDLQTFRLVDFDGSVRTVRALIVRRTPRGFDVGYAARITNFDRPYGFIAPDATPDYPGNNGYACISQNDGRMTNGDPGYLII
ncbi:MAG TPA: hypothetical protein VJT81_06540 [Burkholderiales bacterium]|nr:hypothetical protein [Burkholderiales bacterium]